MNIPVSKTVLRNAWLISFVFFSLLLVFNFFFYTLVTFQLTSALDSRIAHEIEHIGYSFSIHDSLFTINHPSEFLERDLVQMDDNSFFLQIYTTTGTLVLQSANLKHFGAIPRYNPLFDAREHFDNTRTPHELLRTGYRKIYNQKGKLFGYLQLSARRLRLETALEKIIFYNLLMMPLALLLIFITSIFISKHTFRHIKSIINTAERISALNLSERLKLKDEPNDEIEQLKTTLNNLFERLEVQIQQIATFSDNASHQLMSPLTGMNAELDYILKKPIADLEIQQSILLVRQQSERMVGIVRSLLLMARAERDNFATDLIFSPERVIEKTIKPYLPLERVLYKIEPDIYIKGREDYFEIALYNLLDNALKYSNSDALVELTIRQSGSLAVFTVTDFGIGIPDEEKSKVYERFYRGSTPEQIGIPGYGLGLCLVRAIALSMNGTISLTDTNPRGTTAILTLPRISLDI